MSNNNGRGNNKDPKEHLDENKRTISYLLVSGFSHILSKTKASKV
jgi:hypothetical protein